MTFEEREFLENLRELAISAISERRKFVEEGVYESLPTEHPLQQMRILISERLKGCRGISVETKLKVWNAAKLRANGEKWSTVDDLYTDSFRRSLQTGGNYHEEFEAYLAFAITQRSSGDNV